MRPSGISSSAFWAHSYIRMLTVWFAAPCRAFEEIHRSLDSHGHHPFLKRYLRRNEILSRISACDTSLNDALEMFGVRVVFQLVGHPSRSALMLSSASTALFPVPCPKAHPSQRATAREGNARSARIALARLS